MAVAFAIGLYRVWGLLGPGAAAWSAGFGASPQLEEGLMEEM